MILLLILALLQPAPPTLTVTWQGTMARVAWSGLPRGACVVKGETLLSDTCNDTGTHPDGSLLLTGAGRDAAYAPRGGERYRVVVSGTVLAEAELPRMTTALPIVAGP